MKYLTVWRHDDVRRKRTGSGKARRKAANTAERRKLLNNIGPVVEIDVTCLWPAIYTNLLVGTHGWIKCDVVAKSRIDRQFRRGPPRILYKFAHYTAGARFRNHVAPVCLRGNVEEKGGERVAGIDVRLGVPGSRST